MRRSELVAALWARRNTDVFVQVGRVFVDIARVEYHPLADRIVVCPDPDQVAMPPASPNHDELCRHKTVHFDAPQESRMRMATSLPPLDWKRSSKASNSGNCVEVAQLPERQGVAVRGSKDPDGPVLVYGWGQWQAFLEGANDYEFDFIP